MSLGHETLNDIKACREIIKQNDVESAKKQVEILTSGYEDFIPSIKKDLTFYSIATAYGATCDYIGDLEKIQKRLELFLANDCKPIMPKRGGGIRIDNYNINENVNEAIISLNTSIKQVKQEIESNGSLHQKEIEEILAKLKEIKEISEIPENKNRKWDKLKNCLEWLSTKGVDVAVKILPLIIKAVET